MGVESMKSSDVRCDNKIPHNFTFQIQKANSEVLLHLTVFIRIFTYLIDILIFKDLYKLFYCKNWSDFQEHFSKKYSVFIVICMILFKRIIFTKIRNEANHTFLILFLYMHLQIKIKRI